MEETTASWPDQGPQQPPGHPDIDTLQVSDAWKQKFRLLMKAGGPGLPRFKTLSFGERFRVNFNLLAFLFGPFYYLAKGMCKKAICFFGVWALIIITLGYALDLAGLSKVADALGYGAAAFFGTRANIDYYKKMVLQDNGWW